MKLSSKEEYLSGVFTKFLMDFMVAKRIDDKGYTIANTEAGILVRRYRAPKRYYHTIEHAYNVYQQVQWIEKYLESPKAVLFAAWYHDIEYVVGRTDNELISGLDAKRVLEILGGTKAFREKVFNLIQATVYFEKGRIPDDKLTNDQKYLRDADFCIMGEPWKDFCVYEKGIRKEYESIVPSAVYDEGRTEFFRGVLQKPLIFYTEFFQDHCEAQARRNITRMLYELTKRKHS